MCKQKKPSVVIRNNLWDSYFVFLLSEVRTASDVNVGTASGIRLCKVKKLKKLL